MDCVYPECGGLFKWPKHAPGCILDPANMKRPADAPRAGNANHRAHEADEDDDSDADANKADESYLPDTDGAPQPFSIKTETFFDARETLSKFAFFGARSTRIFRHRDIANDTDASRSQQPRQQSRRPSLSPVSSNRL